METSAGIVGNAVLHLSILEGTLRTRTGVRSKRTGPDPYIPYVSSPLALWRFPSFLGCLRRTSAAGAAWLLPVVRENKPRRGTCVSAACETCRGGAERGANARGRLRRPKCNPRRTYPLHGCEKLRQRPRERNRSNPPSSDLR